MRYLLDTNTWIHYLNVRVRPVEVRLRRTQASDIAACSIVRAELLHGGESTKNATNALNASMHTRSVCIAPF